MGYRQFLDGSWTWGTMVGEAVGAFLLVLIWIVGDRAVSRIANTAGQRRLLRSVVVFAAILIGAFAAYGISELHRGSAGSASVSPIFAVFYGAVVGDLQTMSPVVGYLIGFQVLGALLAYLAASFWPSATKVPLKVEKPPVRDELLQSFGVVVLLFGAGLLSIINATSYGAGPALKVLIVSLAFGAAFAVFGELRFYTYLNLFELARMFVIEVVRSASRRGSGRVAAKLPSVEAVKFESLRHGLGICYQGVALALLVGAYGVMQAIPGAGSILI